MSKHIPISKQVDQPENRFQLFPLHEIAPDGRILMAKMQDAIDFSKPIIVYAGDTLPKSSEIESVKQEIGPKPFLGYAIAKTRSKGKIFSQTLTGFDSSDAAAKFVVLSTHCLNVLIKEKTPCNSIGQLIYNCEKTLAKEYQIVIKTPTPTPFSFFFALKNWFRYAIQYYVMGNTNYHKWVFMLLSALALIFMTTMSKTASVSGDEFTQYTYSKLIANYYLNPLDIQIPIDTNELKGQRMPSLAKMLPSMGSDLASIKDPDRLMHLYGSSFDTFTTMLAYFMGVEDYMGFRHWWNALCGFFCVLYTALIVRRLLSGSWLYAWLTFLLVMLMPRFFGEAMNNPKDIPFALGYIMSLYYAIKTFQHWPNFRWGSAFGLVFGTALGISIRIGGLLSIAIFAMYAGLKYIDQIGLKQFLGFKWKGIKTVCIATISMGIGSYILGIMLWPYGWDNPLSNPFLALKEFTNYAVSLRQLYEGKLYDSDMLPLGYLGKYFTISTPLAVLFGLFLFVLFLYPNRKKFNNELFLILFAAIFPIVYIFIQKSQVYGGIRQILFTLPCFVVLSVVGYQWFGLFLGSITKKLQPFPILIALSLLIFPTKFILANHPVSYSYFNEYYGGMKNAYGEFEMDYYLASLRPSTEWFLKNVSRKHPEKKYEVLTYGMDHVKYYCRHDKNVHVGYSRFDERSSKIWDYCIFFNAYFDKARLKTGEFPPKGTIYQQMVDGFPAGVVIERPGFDDVKGIKAIEKDTAFVTGIALLKEYLTLDPNRSEICFYISTAYANLGKYDSAIAYGKKSKLFYPEFSKTHFALFQYYINLNKFDDAEKEMSQFIESRPRDAEGYLMKAQAQLSKRGSDPMIGIITLQEAIAVSPMSDRIYALGAQAFQMKNDLENYNLWTQAALLGNPKNEMDVEIAIEAIKEIYESITGKPLDAKKYGLEE